MSPRIERRSGGPSRDGRQGGSGSGRSSGGRPSSSGYSSRNSDSRSPRGYDDRRPSRERPSGDRPYGNRSSSSRSSTERYSNDRSTNDRFSRDRGPSDRSSSDRPSGDRFSKDRFSSNRSSSNRPQRERPSSYGSSGDRPYGRRDGSSPRPYGQRDQQGSRPYGRREDRREDRSPRFSGRPDDDGKRPYERRDDQGARSSAPNRFRSDRSAQGRFRDRSERSPDRYRSGDERRQSSQRPRFGDSAPRSQRPNLPPEAEASTPPADDLIWGRHASQAALESGRPIHRIWCTPEMRSASKFLQLLREAKASGVLVEEVTWARLAQVTGGSVHQGIALQTAAADTLDLNALIDGCSELGEPPLLLALDGITDPHNLGAVVRSAEAMGAHGLVLPQRRSAGLTGSAAKVAAGAMEHLPVARVVNLNRSLEKLKDSGYRVIGLAAEGDVTLMDVDLDGPLVLVTGSEDQGLSLLTRRHCDQLVRIPLRGITPSLNASVATAMCVYEVARRNWMKDIHGQAPSPPIVRPQVKTQVVSPPVPPVSETPVLETIKAESSKTDPSNVDPSNTELSASDHASEDNASLNRQLSDTGSEHSDVMKTESPQEDSPPLAPTIELDLTGSKPELDLQFDQSIKLSP
ncbi:23S rRNA (guanosine(2251)-2'-O)-methyltransferase RlmB [Synechococcus sp. BL107]|uniref:23S rRNA (guanosine(2251)-2'-O)-methyltransferase RlmB n=1 Tax=Synechococcus sp. BL107 TaxID=313625 RepID=UPI0002F594EA|nr:23S rRNA (guanosine(2251)-2'-O)-methyltransferase RlmB [Synechococcus sp. BL107]